jgi:hypothetical protein
MNKPPDEYFRAQTAEFDKAVAVSELRNLAIEDWKTAKNNELRGVKIQSEVVRIMQKHDAAFIQILIKYPVATIHDFHALDRHSRNDGHRIATHLAQWGRGKRDKPDALQKIIIEIVKSNPSLKIGELLPALTDLKGEGIIEDIDDENISFDDGGVLKDAAISGLKDRLSRAKQKIKKENKSR